MNKGLFQKFHYFVFALLIYKSVFIGIFELVLLFFVNTDMPIIHTIANAVLLTLISSLFFAGKLKFNIYSLFVIFCWFVLLIISSVINPSICDYIVPLSSVTVTNVFSVLLFIPSIKNFCEAFVILRIFLPIAVIYSILEFIMTVIGYNLDYMSFSYAIIIPTMIAYGDFWVRRKLISAFNFFLMVFFIVICGSRGTLVCLFAFILILLSGKAKLYSKMILIGIGLLCVVVLNLFYEPLLNIASKIIPNSRNVALMTKSDVFRLSKRDHYYYYIWSSLVKNPYEFRGIYSDRFALATFFQRTDLTGILSSYTHNIILEILFQFGVVWGGIILIGGSRFIFINCRKINKNKNEFNKYLYYAILCYALVKLQFSDSYLSSFAFSLLISFTISVYCGKKHVY